MPGASVEPVLDKDWWVGLRVNERRTCRLPQEVHLVDGLSVVWYFSAGQPVTRGVIIWRKGSMMTTSSDTSPVSLVTGANKGIGLEAVRRLIGAGHIVYLGARDADRGRPVAESLGARFVQLDVTSDESVSRAAALVTEEQGRLDVLVNNAGITGPFRDVHDYTADDAAMVLMTNLVGYVRVMQAFLPLLELSSDPRIINVSSGLGSFGLLNDPSRKESTAGQPLYAASKAAVNMLSARYAKLLPGIRINIADPGLTDTDLTRVPGHPGAGLGHSVEHGSDAIIAFATGGPETPTGAYRDRDGDLPW